MRVQRELWKRVYVQGHTSIMLYPQAPGSELSPEHPRVEISAEMKWRRARRWSTVMIHKGCTTGAESHVATWISDLMNV